MSVLEAGGLARVVVDDNLGLAWIEREIYNLDGFSAHSLRDFLGQCGGWAVEPDEPLQPRVFRQWLKDVKQHLGDLRVDVGDFSFLMKMGVFVARVLCERFAFTNRQAALEEHIAFLRRPQSRSLREGGVPAAEADDVHDPSTLSQRQRVAMQRMDEFVVCVAEVAKRLEDAKIALAGQACTDVLEAVGEIQGEMADERRAGRRKPVTPTRERVQEWVCDPVRCTVLRVLRQQIWGITEALRWAATARGRLSAEAGDVFTEAVEACVARAKARVEPRIRPAIEKRQLVVAMGTHKRLGAASPLFNAVPDVVQNIAKLGVDEEEIRRQLGRKEWALREFDGIK